MVFGIPLKIGAEKRACTYIQRTQDVCVGSKYPRNMWFDFGNENDWAPTSVAVLAEISLRSPRKLFIFIIKKIIYRIRVFKKYLI